MLSHDRGTAITCSHQTALHLTTGQHLHPSCGMQSDGHLMTALLAGSGDLTALHNSELAASLTTLTLCGEGASSGSLVSMSELAGSMNNLTLAVILACEAQS